MPSLAYLVLLKGHFPGFAAKVRCKAVRHGKQGEELGDENHFALMRAYDRALSDEDGSTFVERDDVDWLDDFELTKDDLADGK